MRSNVLVVDMAARSDEYERLAVQWRLAKRGLDALRDAPDSYATDLYELPKNPTPRHITRMLDDLVALAEAADGTFDERTRTLTESAVLALEALQKMLNEQSAPPDPFAEDC